MKLYARRVVIWNLSAYALYIAQITSFKSYKNVYINITRTGLWTMQINLRPAQIALMLP
jgi:hypothetical protein